MRLSELSTTTGVSVASLKYYLREGLLPPGDVVSRTESSYDDRHVDRVRLVRALIDIGGLRLRTVHELLTHLDRDDVPLHDLLGRAQCAGIAESAVAPHDDWTAVAREYVAGRGWRVAADDPLLDQLGDQFRVMTEADLNSPEDIVDRWADAAEMIAAADLDALPPEHDRAVRQVVVGTALSDGALLTLRRLAQQHLSAERFA